jgi:hypothetical protein
MAVFLNLSQFYEDWQKDLVKKGVKVHLSTELTEVVTRECNGVIGKIIGRTPKPDHHSLASAWAAEDEMKTTDVNAAGETEHYNELVICFCKCTPAPFDRWC